MATSSSTDGREFEMPVATVCSKNEQRSIDTQCPVPGRAATTPPSFDEVREPDEDDADDAEEDAADPEKNGMKFNGA